MEHHHAEGLVFFTDLSRFMTVVQGMTPEELADFMVAHARIVDETISGGGGTLVKYINDSALGIFEGDDVDGAVRTLLTLKHRVETELSTPGRQVQVTIGAHFGPVVMPVLPPRRERGSDVEPEGTAIGPSSWRHGPTRRRCRGPASSGVVRAELSSWRGGGLPRATINHDTRVDLCRIRGVCPGGMDQRRRAGAVCRR